MKIVELSHVCEQIRGVSYRSGESSDHRLPDYLKLYRANNINNGTTNEKELLYISKEKVKDKQILRTGDILIATSSGSLNVVGKAALIHGVNQATFGAFCKVLRPNKKVDPNYFAHFFQSQIYLRYVRRVAAGANINNLKNEHFSTLKIPLPSLEEQKRIAEMLDKAQGLVEKRSQTLKQISLLQKVEFEKRFGSPVNNFHGYPIKTIGDLTESTNYGTSKKADEVNGQYPCLKMNNITYDGDWNFKNLKYVDLAEKELPKYLVGKGDLLFNRTNSKELVGKTAVFQEESPMAYAGYLIRLRTNKMAMTEYISGYLNSLHGKAVLQNMCKNIVGMANINAKELQSIKILVPSIEEQRKYVDFLQVLRKQKIKMTQSLHECEYMYQSLLQRAFKGELTKEKVR